MPDCSVPAVGESEEHAELGHELGALDGVLVREELEDSVEHVSSDMQQDVRGSVEVRCCYCEQEELELLEIAVSERHKDVAVEQEELQAVPATVASEVSEVADLEVVVLDLVAEVVLDKDYCPTRIH